MVCDIKENIAFSSLYKINKEVKYLFTMKVY